jgi:hypothetical protein
LANRPLAVALKVMLPAQKALSQCRIEHDSGTVGPKG